MACAVFHSHITSNATEELKHDGFRAIAYIEDGESGLVSRNLRDFNFLLSNSFAQLPVKNAILDGEVVCLENNGVSRFNQLIARRHEPIFYVFDLLWLKNEDLRPLPLVERKKRLEKLVKKSRCRELLYAYHIGNDGILLFETICVRDLEGIVAKRKNGIYRNGAQGWLKIKNPNYSQAEGRQDLLKRR
jgi:bifunctional non-homologous end joining protein LigD